MKGYKKMGQTEKGVLIFSEWFEAMKGLSAYDFKRMIYAIYRLQIFGEEPPEFQGKPRMIASIIFPMIRRRMELAQYGSLGAAKRLSASKNEAEITPDKNGQASTEESMEASGEASSQTTSPLEAKEKNRKEKNRIPYSPSSESSKGDARTARRAYARGGKAAKSEKDEFFDELFELAVKRSLGEL